MLEDFFYVYSVGDYIGIIGLECFYEFFLCGVKGIKCVEKDIYGCVIGQVEGGR